MAKKGGAVQLQTEVDNEEDWDKLIAREGLIVADIYSDWCGPCTGMVGNLRKLKLEIGGDILTLAIVKSDNIECLVRFRNKSEPTWMFISNGRMLRLMFGANAPRLVRIITEEINKQKKAMEEKVPRQGIDFDELTEEEQIRVDEERRIIEEAERLESEERERRINERRLEVVNNLMEYVKEFNFVVLWPHVTSDGMATIFEAMKDTGMTVANKPQNTKLTDEDLFEMLYFTNWCLTDEAIEEIKEEEVTGLLFQAPLVDFEGDVIQIMLEKFYGESMEPPGDEDSLARKLCKVIKEEIPVDEEEILGEMEEEEEPPAIIHEIPGVWLPENEQTKVVAMRILFPQVTQKFDLPEPEPTPPHLLVAFDAFKKNEVLQLATEFPDDTMHFGFFTSTDTETAKLIAKTSDQYDQILAPPVDGKLVMQISKKSSEPLLSYSLLGPTYVSPNTVVGEKECSVFFPEDYEEPELPVIEETKKKPKKRSRGSRASVSSAASSKVSGESEVPTTTSEEGLEDVQEEEGEGLEDEGDEELVDIEEDAMEDDLSKDGDTAGEEEQVPEPEVTEEDKATSPLEKVEQ